MFFYVLLPFAEERTEFKKLQSISPLLYWITYLLFDAIIHIVFCCILCGVHMICDKHNIFGEKEYGNIIK